MKLFSETDLVITDDIDPLPEIFFEKSTSQILEFTPFPERDEEKHYRCDSFLYSNSTICLIF